MSPLKPFACCMLLIAMLPLAPPGLWGAEARSLTVQPLAAARPAEYSGLRRQTFGVFVGVQEFADESIADLKFCAADAMAVRDCFVGELNYLPAENTRLLVSGAGGNDRPTRANILAAIRLAAQSAGPDGCVIVHLSTHGLEGYVLAEDSLRLILEDTAIALKTIEDYLQQSRSPRRLLIFDACREKVIQADSKALGGGMSPLFARAFSEAEGLAVLMSCSAGQYSYEMPAAQNGAFTHFLLRGLRGGAPANSQGLITVTSLAGWVKGEVEDWSAGRPTGIQSPRFDLRQATGDLPLAFNAAALASVQQLHQRQGELLDVLKAQIDFQVITAQLAQEIFDSLQTARPEQSAELFRRLELLQKNGAAYRSDFALWWTLVGRQALNSTTNMERLNRAYSLITGTAGKIDEAQARKLFQELSDQGDPLAKMWLAFSYNDGNYGFKQDKIQAGIMAKEVIETVKQSANAGDACAMYLIASAYSDGLGIPEDAEQAVFWYRKAAELGNSSAMNNLGFRFAKGKGIEQDDQQAVQWYRKAAELGNTYAMTNLGTQYSIGEGVAQDDEQAVDWFRKAAELGNTYAMTNLGIQYKNGKGVTQDDEQALYWFRKGAELGNAHAMNQLGYRFDQGKGVAQDDEQALYWFRKAAELGNDTAMLHLGYLYKNGNGLKQDHQQAVYWFRKAAEAGQAGGMYNLGLMYENGFGTKQDYKQALDWYRKAAEAGYAFGMNNLGFMYSKGFGVKQDYSQAVYWYRKAAEAGSDGGMTNLGFMYQNGNGVKKNQSQADEWYQQAARLGNKDAREILRKRGKSW